MGELLADVLPLALGAAISPTLLGVQLLTLGAKIDPLPRAWALAAGAGAVLAAFSVAGLLIGFGTDQAAAHPSKVDAAIKLAVAVLLLWLGIRAAVRGPTPGKHRGTEGEPKLGRAAAIGAVLMLTNITTLALYFPAMHEIGVSDVDAIEKLVAVLLVYAITMSLVVAPPLATSVLGERGRAATAKMGDLMARHRRSIATLVPLAFAVVLIAEAVPDL